ncbi:MAG: hypothetical protein RL616_2413 [Verrucomicrobiota bacterium]|jgi:hypothetical protein
MNIKFIKFLAVGLIVSFVCLVSFLVLVGKTTHRHCLKQAGSAFMMYSSEHFGQLPYSTNGFGDALLQLAGSNSTNDYLGGFVECLCAPGDDGKYLKEALENHAVVREERCTRVYIQGLCETNDSQLCILFDRNSCRGGDHGRSPWGHPLREACLLDGSMQIIRDEDWLEFSQKQVELLVAAGFTRTNALHFYPAAK